MPSSSRDKSRTRTVASGSRSQYDSLQSLQCKRLLCFEDILIYFRVSVLQRCTRVRNYSSLLDARIYGKFHLKAILHHNYGLLQIPLALSARESPYILFLNLYGLQRRSLRQCELCRQYCPRPRHERTHRGSSRWSWHRIVGGQFRSYRHRSPVLLVEQKRFPRHVTPLTHCQKLKNGSPSDAFRLKKI